jgi:translation initiation factor IF-2
MTRAIAIAMGAALIVACSRSPETPPLKADAAAAVAAPDAAPTPPLADAASTRATADAGPAAAAPEAAPEAAPTTPEAPAPRPGPAVKPEPKSPPAGLPGRERKRPAPAAAPGQGARCTDGGRCADGLTCIEYHGIAGAAGPTFTSCEIPCGGKARCPAGQRCITISDGPGSVCRKPMGL